MLFRSGNGGSYATAGSGGSPSPQNGGAGGGAGGNSVSGNSNITWPSLGTVYGPRVG